MAKYFRTPDQSYKSAIALNCKHLRLTRIWVLYGNKLALWLIVIRLFIYKYIDRGVFFGRKPPNAIALIRERRKCTNWVRYSPLGYKRPKYDWGYDGPKQTQKKHFEKSQTLKRRSKHIRAQFRGNNNPLRYNLHVWCVYVVLRFFMVILNRNKHKSARGHTKRAAAMQP